MITICNICLRSDRKLWSLNFSVDLEHFYNEITKNSARVTHKYFCAICIYKLKKHHEFQKCCKLADEKLKKWEKQSTDERKPINLLHKEIPASQRLSLCSKNNSKLYIVKSAELNMQSLKNNTNIVTEDAIAKNRNMPPSIEISRNNNTDIVTENIANRNIIKLQCDIKNNIGKVVKENQALRMAEFKSQNIVYQIPYIEYLEDEVENLEDEVENLEDEVEYLEDEFENDVNVNTSDCENKIVNNEKDAEDENETRINEIENSSTLPEPNNTVSIILNNPTDQEMNHEFERKLVTHSYANINYDSNGEIIDLETMKIKLKEKFEMYGPIKGPKGNVIDPDIVLNKLEKIKFVEIVNKSCKDAGPLSNFVIRQLSQLQDTIMYGDIFDMLYFRNPKEIKAEFEKRRELATYLKYEHRCEICITGFAHRGYLAHHMKTSHDPENPFECNVCHIRKATKLTMTKHIHCHKHFYKCKLCDYSTNYRVRMVDHYNVHTGKNNYKCKYCTATFAFMSGVYAHINASHETNHFCNLCAMSFNNAKGLRSHKNIKHRNESFVESEQNKKCEECNVVFISEEIYNEHMDIQHKIRSTHHTRLDTSDSSRRRIKNIEKAGDYLCQICGMQIKHRYLIQEHMSRHSGERPHTCSKCPKSFVSKIGLWSHMLWHSPPTYTCNICDKKFHTNTGLSSHKRAHIKDRKHVCDICGKGFVFPGSLKEHVTGVHQHKRRIKKRRPKNTQ